MTPSTNQLGPDRGSYPSELLAVAERLLRDGTNTKDEASLRRAVSTAYYALFHLLIVQATENWNQEIDRPIFARLFEHGKMKAACLAIKNASPQNKNPIPSFEQRKPPDHMRAVARAFIEAQSQREIADYDLSERISPAEARIQVELVNGAFASWAQVRGSTDAHRFLMALLGTRQDRR